ncbi:MAG TPA: carbonic anhydrase [Patescibacteria group bacterium]|nr:carbonic anhydrase [Patescibacteria group bacterium]
MSSLGETFFTSVGCMDGRVQAPIEEYGQKRYGVKYPDTITEAGIVGLLGQDNVDSSFLESVKKKVLISVEKHHSKGIIVHGHEECVGNPIENEKHKKETIKAVEKIKSFVSSELEVKAVFVERENNNWVVNEL